MPLDQDRQRLYALTLPEVTFQLDADRLAQAQRLVEQGGVVEASVEDAALYAVVQEDTLVQHAVDFEIEDGEIYLDCTCGYGGPNICAHVGAVLLAWIQSPETFAGYDPSLRPSSPDTVPSIDSYEGEYLQMLGQQTIQELRTIAQRRGIEVKGTRKEPIVAELSARLADPVATRTYVDGLPRATQDLLIYLNLIMGPGYGFTGESIVNNLLKKHDNLPRRTLYEQTSDLAQQGLLLLFKRDDRAYYMLPQIVRMALPTRPGLVPPYPPQEVETLETRQRPATAMAQSLYALWAYIVEHSPRREPVAARLPAEDRWPQLLGWDHHPEEVDDLVRRNRTPYNLYNASLTVPTPPFHLRSADRILLQRQQDQTDVESDFYYMLLESLSAVHAAPGEGIAPNEEAFVQLLSVSPSLQVYLLLSTWLDATTWSEMDLVRRRTDDIRVRRNLNYSSFKPAELHREWRAGRQAVLRFLSTIPEGQWVSVSGFLKVIYEILPEIVHSHTDRSVWWLESRRTRKQFGTTIEDWLESSGRFVTAVLEGPLYWFGAVGLAYQESRLVAFKLTPVASLALQRRSLLVDTNPQLPADDTLQLTGDMVVTMVPGQVPAQLHEILHSLGRLQEARPDRFVYQITAEGVLSALQEGQTIDRLLETLRHWLNRDVPPAWEHKMRTWSQNYGKLHVYEEITLIELADDYALQELLSNTSLRDHVIYQFSPRLVAIRPDAVDGLVQEMESRGYTPYVE